MDKSTLNGNKDGIQRRVDFSIITALIVIICAFQLWSIDRQSLWYDEIYTLSNATGVSAYPFENCPLQKNTEPRSAEDWQKLVTAPEPRKNTSEIIINEGHPPLYTILIASWTHFTGASSWAIRCFSVLCYLGTVLLAWVIGNSISTKITGSITAAAIALCPTVFYYATEARSYALFLLTITISTAGFLLTLDRFSREAKSTRWIALWGLGSVLSIYTHYFAAVWITSSFAAICLSAASTQCWSKYWRPLLVTGGCVIASCLGLYPLWSKQVQLHAEDHWTKGAYTFWEEISAGIRSTTSLLSGEISTHSMMPSIIVMAAVIWLAIKSRPLLKSGNQLAFWTAAVVVVHIVLIALVDIILDHHTADVPRYSIAILPLIIAIAIPAVVGNELKMRVVGGCIFSIAVFLSVSGSLGHRNPKQMYREVGGYLANVAPPNARVLVVPGGPSIIGVAIYTRPDLTLEGSSVQQLPDRLHHIFKSTDVTYIIAQRMGLSDELWSNPGVLTDAEELNCEPPIHFVGLDLFKVTNAQ